MENPLPWLNIRLRVALIGLGGLLGSLIFLLLWSEGALTSPSATWTTLENAIITLIGEYPDKPKTVPGQVFQLLLFIFGTFVFGAIVGKFSSFFVTQALSQESRVKPFNDHIIICNWNEKAVAIIHQLLQANRSQPRDIVIISASEIEDQTDLGDRPNIYFVQADPTHHATLEKHRALQAKAIILLADEDTDGPDEKNALIALAVKHLEQTPGQEKDIHVIAELVKLNRHRHLKEAGVDEVISAREYSSGIIAQSALFVNMSVVYQQLLTYSDDTNEFYFLEPGKYPPQLVGMSFCAMSEWISEYSAAHPRNPILLMGIKRPSGEILLNPRTCDFTGLGRDDTLIVMAFQHIDSL
ncbi:NAD-binding protein [Candidatus Synechococcus calcipolaris G9]|uniref:NAD-binding protein n=1 Tax=Candidatus Synechococcus calcipolaris G9 TaxID=1497997 RepID=A0ABT6ETX6_9SYNE|nr:NAD-binding protein [Candidatus Synechococcus calcipolaris]MDG2989366.1 NAD-binding protein [Candidatus Synechococcus calcipolaris G9]